MNRFLVRPHISCFALRRWQSCTKSRIDFGIPPKNRFAKRAFQQLVDSDNCVGRYSGTGTIIDDRMVQQVIDGET